MVMRLMTVMISYYYSHSMDNQEKESNCDNDINNKTSTT